MALSFVPAVLAGAAETGAPPMLSRQEWKALPADPALMTQHQPVAITIHNTARAMEPAVPLPSKLRRMQRFAQRPHVFASGTRKPQWGDIAYHFIIGEDGTLAEGRDIHYAGDTNTDYDPKGHILVVLEGNFARETPTPAQMRMLRRTVLWLARAWTIPPDLITGHKDHSRKTGCPGTALYARLPELRDFVEKAMRTD